MGAIKEREEVLNKFGIELQKVLVACQEQLDLFVKLEQQGLDKLTLEIRKNQEAAKESIDQQIKELADWLANEQRKKIITEDDLFAGLENLSMLEPIYKFYKLASRQTFGIVEQPKSLPLDFINSSELERVKE